jgi:hypothetical protein
MTLAWLLLITGLTISAVAIYYSVVGLAAIFSAAVIPIIVMGSALEVAKLVCASWLKANWSRTPILMKTYMTIAVIVLMAITSMGIFGFLSKAHSDQSLVSGDVMGRIAIYDEKIKTSKENIDANRKALRQMDEAVDQSMARSNDEKGADKAVAIRRGQAKERARLQKEIADEQATVAKLNEESAPIRAEVRKVEAEVGPLKYIAKLIYGDAGADENMLERAVTWVIILIVVVFDPLAVIMLLAAQMTFGWKKEDPVVVKEEVESEPAKEPFVGVIAQEVASVIPEAVIQDSEDSVTILKDAKEKLAQFVDKVNLDTGNTPLIFETVKSFSVPEVKEVVQPEKLETYIPKVDTDVIDQVTDTADDISGIGLEAWNKMIDEAEKAAELEKKLANVVWTDALQLWREKHLDADIYEIQRSYDAGEIKILPWNEEDKKYKILPELINTNYVQNEEQVESGLWQETTQSLSQNDYQQKVLEANIRTLVNLINNGSILVEQLSEEEASAVAEYLKKESNDGEDNNSKSA